MRHLRRITACTIAFCVACVILLVSHPALALCRERQHQAFREMGLIEIPTSIGTLWLAPQFEPHRQRIVDELEAIDIASLTQEPQPHPFTERIPEAIQRVNQLLGVDPEPEVIEQQSQLAKNILQLGSYRLADPVHLRIIVAPKELLHGYINNGNWIPGFTADPDAKLRHGFSMNTYVQVDQEGYLATGSDEQTGTGIDTVLLNTQSIDDGDTPIHANAEMAQYLVLPNARLTDIQPWIVLHEIAETSLIREFDSASAYDRWFNDGFAEAAAALILKDMGFDNTVENMLAARAEEMARIEPQETSLRYWPYINFSYRSHIDLNDFADARYAYAGQFVTQLIEQYGREFIAQAVKDIAAKRDPADPESLIRVLSQTTGEDIAARLRPYQRADTIEEIAAYHRSAYFNAVQEDNLREAFHHLSEIKGLDAANLSQPRFLRAAKLLSQLGCTPDGLRFLRSFQDSNVRTYPDNKPLQQMFNRAIVDYAIYANHPEWAADAAEQLLAEYPSDTKYNTIKVYTLHAQGQTDQAQQLAAAIAEQITPEVISDLDFNVAPYNALMRYIENPPPPAEPTTPSC